MKIPVINDKLVCMFNLVEILQNPGDVAKVKSVRPVAEEE